MTPENRHRAAVVSLAMASAIIALIVFNDLDLSFFFLAQSLWLLGGERLIAYLSTPPAPDETLTPPDDKA